MNKIVRLITTVLTIFLFILTTAPCWAATAAATVSVTIRPVTKISLDRDANSVTRGSATQVVFDKVDDDDMPGGDAGYMYAPYRSETGKNWHIAKLTANGSSLTFSAAVSGNIGTTPLADVLKTWCGGLYKSGGVTPIEGTPSTDWEFLNGWQRTLSQSFSGIAPFNYQLNIADAQAGSYTGLVTFTLVSN